MSLLQLQDVCAGYGELRVLQDVCLEVLPGEMVVLIGPNGAGKSTVLKTIYGLTNQTSGSVMFRGNEISTLPTHSLIEEGIGFVPQGRLVFPSLSVKENLEMGGYLLNHKETIQENLEHVFSLFPALLEKQKEQAGALSGGQQQQLAIGRSLMMKPDLLMLDEPSLGLSPKLMHEVFGILKTIQAQGTTILVVEQNVHLALKYADRGYLLANGCVRFSGTSKELGNETLMKEAFLT